MPSATARQRCPNETTRFEECWAWISTASGADKRNAGSFHRPARAAPARSGCSMQLFPKPVCDAIMLLPRRPAGPLVSIIIPTYNRRDLLSEAVASCLSQTWGNLEILVVDDGSTDGTDAFVSREARGSWADRASVRYYKQANKGASSARNIGLGLATGEYVQFLDSDDVLHPTKIAEQVRVLELPECQSAVCCNCYGTMGPSPTGGHDSLLERIGHEATDPKELVRELCSRHVHGMQTSAPLWRRGFLVTRAGWREDIALGDDLEYHIRLLVDAAKICFIGKALFFVREHPGPRLSADALSTASLESLLRTRRAIFATLQMSGLWDAETQRIFLDAMRTIYANALRLDDRTTIHDLESWLWTLAAAPKRCRQFHVLIVLRRLLGRYFLLGTHALVRKLGILRSHSRDTLSS